jgi:PAS domain S-box-containing protein
MGVLPVAGCVQQFQTWERRQPEQQGEYGGFSRAASSGKASRIAVIGKLMKSSLERGFAGRRLSDVLGNLPVAMAVQRLDAAGTILFVNEHFVRLLGYTTVDIPTVADWAARAYPDAAYRREVFDEWDAAVARASQEEGLVESMECRVTCKGGVIRNVIIGAAVVDDHLIATLTDITERRQLEDQLQTARAELERTAYELTENIPAGTYTMVQPASGGIGFFSFMSQRFLDICGLNREEARSDPFKAFACVHPEDHAEWVRKNAEAFSSKRPFYGECRVIADGSVKWIMAESQPRDLPDGSIVWEGVLVDITRQKLAEEQLAGIRDAERRLEEARRLELEGKLKTSLTAAATMHEIEQPLASILLETQMTLERMRVRSLEPAEVATYLEEMLVESQQVVDMIGRMKALLRNVQTEYAPVRVAEVIASSILYSKKLIADHGVTVHEAGLDPDIQIHGDASQLQTAMVNLIRNAIDAAAGMPAGRRDVAVELRVHSGGVTIVVGDSGPGMTDDQIRNLPFETTKPHGTGLGLYLVRTCVDNHGGSMSVGRSPLGGAEISLNLPFRRRAT